MIHGSTLTGLLWLFSLPFFLAEVPAAASTSKGKKIDTRTFLSSAMNDPVVKLDGLVREDVTKLSGDTPLLHEVEARVGLDSKTSQKVALRFSPRGWGETSALRSMEASVRELVSSKYVSRLNIALQQRYFWIAQHQHLQDQLRNTQNLIEIKEGFIKIYRAFLKSGKLQVFELADAEEKLEDLLLKHEKLKKDIFSLESQMARAFNATYPSPALPLAQWQLPRPEKLRDNALKLLSLHKTNNKIRPYLAEKQAEVKVRSFELAHLASERRRWVSFLELSASIESNGDKKFTGEIAFPIPLVVANGRFKEETKRSELARDERLIETSILESQKYLLELEFRLKSAVNETLKYSRSDHSKRLNQYLFTYKKKASLDVLTTQKIKQLMVEREMKLYEQVHEVVQIYLELLDELGVFSRAPLTNYFSATLDYLGEDLGEVSGKVLE